MSDTTSRRSRRPANMLAVALVGAVALVAGWDALRQGGGAPVGERGPLPGEDAAALRAAGAAGELVFSDGACRRHRLTLPALGLTRIPRFLGCEVFAHRGSLGVVGGEVGWYAFPGGVTMLLRRGQLDRELARRSGVPGSSRPGGHRVVAAAWLANTRYAVLVEGPTLGDRRLLALFERSRLSAALAELGRNYAQLRASPRGGYVAALDPGGGVAVYDAAGRAVVLPSALDRPHAVAWSADERLTAVADARGIAVLPARGGSEEVARLGLQARDLAWRP